MVEVLTEKTLLKAMERLNCPLDEVDLRVLCNTNKVLFGEKGSALRRKIQSFVNNLKKRSARNYARLLEKHQIPQSETTKAWVERCKREPSPTNSPVGNRGSMDDGGGGGEISNLQDRFGEALKITTSTTPSVPQESSPSKGLAPPSLPKRPSLTTTNALFNPFNPAHQQTMSNVNPTSLFGFGATNSATKVTSNAKPPPTLAVPNTPPTGLQQQNPPTIGSPAPSAVLSGFSNQNTPGASSVSSVYFEKGSKQNPELIEVDLARPEKHGPFDVKINPKKVCRGIPRQTLHFKKLIGVQDPHLWKAFMDLDDVANKDRAIIIQGPSRPSYLRATTTRTIENEANTDIRSADVNAEEAIRDDPSRATYFWKLVTPVGFELDNMSLSQSHFEIEKNTYVNTESIQGKKTKYEIHSMFAEWEIARKGPGIKVAVVGKNDDNGIDKLFKGK